MFDFLKRKLFKIKNGERVSMVLYKGCWIDQRDMLLEYVMAFKESGEKMSVTDPEGHELFMKVEGVISEELDGLSSNEKALLGPDAKCYMITLKGVITNE